MSAVDLPALSAGMVPLHLGTFHSYEWVLMLALILGPFLGLAVTIVLVRRRDALEHAGGREAGTSAAGRLDSR